MNNLLNVAHYKSIDNHVEHNMFSAFIYYDACFKIEPQKYSCVINVGVTKDSNIKQVYDINQIRKK